MGLASLIVLPQLGELSPGEGRKALIKEIVLGLVNGLAIGLVLVAAAQQAYGVRSTLLSVDYRPQAVFWQKLGNELRDYSVVGITQDYGFRMQYWGRDNVEYWPTTGDFAKTALSGEQVNQLSLFKKKTSGKQLFLVTDMNELDKQPLLKAILYDNYPIFDQGDGYIIFDLRK